jgi:cell division protein FtsA
LTVADIVLEQLASSEAVLSQDEKELGVALIDIGGGTTDLAIWSEGSIIHTSVLAIGGDHITNDIAVGLRTPMEDAERIKQKFGCALGSMVDDEESIEVPSVGGRKPRVLSKRILTEIIEPRVEEMFSLVHQEIHRTGYEDLLASGVVITGGATLLEGMPELAEDILGLPVRMGMPSDVGGLVDVVRSPIYSTGVGLVLYGRDHEDARFFRVREENVYSKVRSRMRSWLGDIF